MTHLDTLDRNDLYSEIAELAREQGVDDQATWNELVDEVIESHLAIGELDPDQDLENVRSILHESWGKYQNEAGDEARGNIQDEPQEPAA